MGFFSSEKSRPKPKKKSSLTDPPTQYTTKPPLPARPPNTPHSHPPHHNTYPPPQQLTYPPSQSFNYPQNQITYPSQNAPPQPERPCPPRANSAPNDALSSLSSRFSDLLTQIDCESLTGNETNLFSCPSSERTADRSLALPGTFSSALSGTYFSKVEQYSNSKLPAHLPPLNVFIPTWALICLAAQYSLRVYSPPTTHEQDSHIASSWRAGSVKTTFIKSVPLDATRVIVFAIRGTASFMDWAVNFKTSAAAPSGFLDDCDNYCHAGFLSVARKMVVPVAARIRQLLEQDPGRASYSLLITGHSAGGAVAALLYSHLTSVAPETESELNVLAGCFKRIHCITFGAPPVSLLPLKKPLRPELRKSLFFSFINEGDPVARADKAYVRSLLELLGTAPPQRITTWPIPESTLSNAGRIVVLRPENPKGFGDKKTVEERLDEGVQAVTCREDELRGVVWGDPVCHLMRFYKERVDRLAVEAVTGVK